ncbi:hypothetical protein B0H17DRAFT_1213285 [Mycena rosella]|uniref:Uncharacterized protein n=1 Tax=Mycena rosella TaxID=1033263 RepID=A0AAD7G496_MYCRO|nr:hypothetical protein B0H17DRAFT_1213285 [Mycena rosella]
MLAARPTAWCFRSPRGPTAVWKSSYTGETPVHPPALAAGPTAWCCARCAARKVKEI